MELLSYTALTFRNDAVDALFARAERLAAPKSIFFKLDANLNANAAAREFTDFWLVWLRVQTPEKLAHELGHIIVDISNHTPVLDPDRPTGATREFLGNVTGLLDHPAVHELLRDAGLDDRGESRNALSSFLAEAQSVAFDGGQPHPFMAVGYANMSLTHSTADPDVFRAITAVLSRRSPETLGAGERIVEIVIAQQDSQSLDTIARRICDMLNVRSDVRNAIWPWDRKVLAPYIP